MNRSSRFPLILTFPLLATQLAFSSGPPAGGFFRVHESVKSGAATYVKDVDPAEVHCGTIAFQLSDPWGLEARANDVNDPKSPNYGQFISPEELESNYGVGAQFQNKFLDYLQSKGFVVNWVSTLGINFCGPAALFHQAFNTHLREFVLPDPNDPRGVQHIKTNSEAPVFPAEIERAINTKEAITAVVLGQGPAPKRHAFSPSQVRSLYQTAPLFNGSVQGQGRTIGISSYDGFRLSNVSTFYSTFNLPTPTGGLLSNITVVPINGGMGGTTPSAEGDVDIQMVLGVAPLANLTIYDGGNFDFIGVLTKEVSDNLADIITESYGWQAGAQAVAAHNLHLSMSAQGITYVAASGDDGTADNSPSSSTYFPYPNYDPEVLIVGGTVASVDGQGDRQSEVGWSGSGGGWVTEAPSPNFNVLPSYQAGLGVPTGINYRLFPDVALNAGAAYSFIFNGSLNSSYLGTSFASPTFAGSLALMEQQVIAQGGMAANGAGKHRLGRIQDMIYAQRGRSDIWTDITSGNNGTLPNGNSSSAGKGWDFVTGWGVPNFQAWAAALTASGAPSHPLTASAVLGAIQLSWYASGLSGVSYNIKRATTSGGPYNTIANVSVGSYGDLPPAPSTTYYYVISSVTGSVESANSTEVSMVSPVAAPTSFTAVAQ